jgi:hypothetical protein
MNLTMKARPGSFKSILKGVLLRAMLHFNYQQFEPNDIEAKGSFPCINENVEQHRLGILTPKEME